MKIRSVYKTIIFYAAAIFAALAAYQIYPSIDINDKESGSFSSVRVANDINIISKHPHSIEHPKEKKVVANYLYHRLEQLGGRVQSFEYDSIKCKFGGYLNIENIYASFDPTVVTDSTGYILLVAHYDSRYHQRVLEDTVYSYGAADDGYGVGVILESLNVALKYRESWKQGIKVLYTDAEEHNLDGMRSMVHFDNHILKGVNMVINVEARGVKGPALLFETSSGNRAVMELYKKVRNPYTYSLTTLVYSILPNNTDFSVVKDSIPGMNFSVIDNLKYYHTDKDNFSNISLKSIEHYGLQIVPMLEEYLKGDKYGSKGAFESNEDLVFFTIPLLGLFSFTKSGYILLNILTFILFALALWIYVRLNRIRLAELVRSLLWPLVFFVGAFVAGEAIGWIAAYFNGEEFDLVSVKYVGYDYVLVIVSAVVLFLWHLIFYRLNIRKRGCFAYEYLFASLLFAVLLSMVLMIAVLENFFILVPLLVSVVALLMALLKGGKVCYLLSGVIIMLLGFSFCYCLITALTIGSLGVVLMLCSIYFSMLIGQYYLFKRNI